MLGRILGWILAIIKLFFPKPVPDPTPDPEPVPVPVPDDTIKKLLDKTNEIRKAAGKLPLLLNDKLNLAAQKHSKWMADHNKMSHTEGTVTVGRRANNVGYAWRSIGENIAMGYKSVDSVMNGWRNSTGHYFNIIGKYVDVGFGLAYSSDGSPYWTSVFGTPGMSDSDVPSVYLSGPMPYLYLFDH